MRRILIAVGILLAGLVSSCTAAQMEYPMPTIRPTITPTYTPTTPPTETPEPQVTAQPGAQAAMLGLPGNSVEGARLFSTFNPRTATACNACHRVDSDERLIGPGLLTVGQRAATRVPGMSAFDYLHTSIVDPSAYIVEGYPNLMPKTWGSALTEEQIDDIIAYLFSLSSAPGQAIADASATAG